MNAVGDDSLLEQTLDRLLRERCRPEDRQAAEAVGWAPGCWDTLADAGLTTMGVPEASGGSGGTVGDVCTLLRLAGRHAVALPLAETTMLGGWLLSRSGLRPPPGPITVAVPHPYDTLALDGSTLSGQLGRVPWAARAVAVAALVSAGGDGEQLVLIDPGQVRRISGRNLAGEPRDRIEVSEMVLEAHQIAPLPDGTAAELALRGALSRALMMAGAMDTAAELTVGYAAGRRQFGRPIAAFQAVGQRLAMLASEAEAAGLAAKVAARRFAEAGPAAATEVAMAKISAGRSASALTAHAHQVHGAIGMTQEYPLHHFTRRLWAWRQEWGSQRRSATQVADMAVTAGAAGLWPLVTTGLVQSR